MQVLQFLLWASISLAFGSFINVLVHRVPSGSSILGRSFCPDCNHEISAVENIPVLSYLFLRGKCSHCRNRISPRYPLIEALTLLVSLLVVYQSDRFMIQLAWFIFVVFGIALSAIDLEHFRLPNVLTLPLALAIFILLLIDSTQLHQYRDLRYAIYSSLALTFFYFLVHLISRGGLGFGDVKFAIAIGFLTGYGSTIGTYVASMLAFILGSIVGLFLITIKGGGRKTKVPLGPFMFAGAIASIWVIPHIEALLL